MDYTTTAVAETATAANLAVVLAQAGKDVILVSADLHEPRAHVFFGLSNETGLLNVLGNQMDVMEALQQSRLERLRLLAEGPPSDRSVDLLQSEEMASLLHKIRESADFVIVDTSPVLASADPLALASMVDGVLLVADAGKTSRHAVIRARENLEQVGARIMGCVLNDFDPAHARSYEPYVYRRYSYGRRYGGGGEGYGAGYESGSDRPQDRRGPPK